MAETLCSGNVTTKLQRIAELARGDRGRVFTSVAHAIDLEWVKEACRRTRKDGAAGVDGDTWAAYATNLEANLSALATKIRAGTYRPPPVRRAYIPKASGGERPIGIPTYFNYFGITGNGDALARFRSVAARIWGRSLARRNNRRFAWRRFVPLLERFPLPMPRPVHSVAPSEPAT
jgi:hypothetical protein